MALDQDDKGFPQAKTPGLAVSCPIKSSTGAVITTTQIGDVPKHERSSVCPTYVVKLS